MSFLDIPLQPRARNSFPTTVGGKAFDTGLVMSWLEDEVNSSKAWVFCTLNEQFWWWPIMSSWLHDQFVTAMSTGQVDPEDELFALCAYMVRCTNRFFRTIREGILLRGDVCTISRTMGHEMNASWMRFILARIQRIVPLTCQRFSWSTPIGKNFWFKKVPSKISLVSLVPPESIPHEVAYASLAAATFDAGYKLFRYRPKFHLGVHLMLDIGWPVALNPNSTLTCMCILLFFTQRIPKGFALYDSRDYLIVDHPRHSDLGRWGLHRESESDSAFGSRTNPNHKDTWKVPWSVSPTICHAELLSGLES